MLPTGSEMPPEMEAALRSQGVDTSALKRAIERAEAEERTPEGKRRAEENRRTMAGIREMDPKEVEAIAMGHLAAGAKARAARQRGRSS